MIKHFCDICDVELTEDENNTTDNLIEVPKTQKIEVGDHVILVYKKSQDRHLYPSEICVKCVIKFLTTWNQ